MSPLSSERVVIGLAPEQLSALALGGRFRPRLLDQHVLPLPGQPASAWEQGIAALDLLLAEAGWRGRAVTVVLSSHYVRHVVVPAQADLAESELQTLAGVVFRDIFGELAGEWELRVSPARASAATLACGVPRALLASLDAVCATHGRLRSVQPGLMPVFNRVRREIGTSAACLALIETERVTIASIEHGQWQYVDSRAGPGGILPHLLQEEGELHERQPGGILWLCDLTGATSLPADAYWSQRRVEPPRLPGFDAAPDELAGPATNLALWGAA